MLPHLPQGKGKTIIEHAMKRNPGILHTLPFLLSLSALLSCEYVSSPFGKPGPGEEDPQAIFATQQPTDSEFANYWYSGKAELNTYEVVLSRYGQNRHGQSLLIFVTEDMDPERQVKIEGDEEPPPPKINVLKRNSLLRFTTGIYDYSLMNSVFTPISLQERLPALKDNMTAQDWCGQSFLQVNRRGERYFYRQFSYFGSQGDKEQKITEKVVLEDDLFNWLRLSPNLLPEGEYNFLPGLFYLYLTHEKPKPHAARLTYRSGEAAPQCVIEYLHLNRTLIIDFEADFPHHILGWTEKDDQKVLLKAERKESLQTPYWSQNAPQFESLRDSLGIHWFE